MENQNSNHPQAAPPLPESVPQPEPPNPDPPRVRPNRNFPLYYVETPQGGIMMDSVRCAEYEASLRAAEAERTRARDQARAAREAELVAGRPPSPSPASSSIELSTESVSSTLARYNSSLARSSSTSPSAPPDLERHSRCCSICSHPDRDAIEGDFIRWRRPIDIAADYGLADRRIIYRHAHATGLFTRRTREVARTMELYLELVDHDSPAEQAPFDFNAVTRAVRVYSHLDHDGRWFEPPRTHFVLTGPISPPEPPLCPSGDLPSQEFGETTSLPVRPRLTRKKLRRGKTRRRHAGRVKRATRHIPKVESEPKS